MATMIPEFFDDVSTAPGEQDVFGWLRKCPSDWLVFHSLDLQAWNRNRQTEVDFVVIIPDSGILCIEVKSHHRVEVTKSGTWNLNGVPAKRTPPKQAEDAAKVLQRRISDCLPQLKHLPICRLIVFPRAAFDLPQSVEFHTWEVFDAAKCLKDVQEGNFDVSLRSSLRLSVAHSSVVRQLERPLTPKEISTLRDLLRPTFKSHPSSQTDSLRRRQHIDDLLLSQQKPILNLFQNNERLVVEGPAGSGKTLIGLELARRAAERGSRTALVCFNRFIGDHLELEASNGGPLFVAGSIYSLLARLLDIKVPESPSTEYWKTDFLQESENKLLSSDYSDDCSFDVLIVDEAQDFLSRSRLLNCVEFLLRGGFQSGRWALFGDFKNQVLTDDKQRIAAMTNLARFKKIGGAASYSLDENCRNYAIVGKPCLSLAGMEEVYSGYRRGDGSHEAYTPIFFKNRSTFATKLEAEIRRFVECGFPRSEIVVLSCTGAEQSIAADLVGSEKLLKRYGAYGDQAQFASVYEFKGLESSVIILVDVREPQNERDRQSFYVGMTRATYAVSLLIPQDLNRWFLNATMRLFE